AGAKQREMIPFADFWERAIFGEEIAGFADWADDVGADGCAALFADRNDFVIGIVKGWADQVVHGGIHDDEILFAGAFHVLDAGDEDAGVAGDETAGLDEDSQS